MKNIIVEDPATRQVIGEYAATPVSEVKTAVEKLKIGGQRWARLGFEERRRILNSCADKLDESTEEIARLITSEMGRPLIEANGEVPKSAAFIRYFADNAESILSNEEIDISGHTLPEKNAHCQYFARGVAGLIKPWNAPVQQLIWGLAPALAAGCSVLMKPSEYTPGSALLLEKALRAGGLPDDVYMTMIGGGELGAEIAKSEVDVISFTGSLETGRLVAAAAATQPTKTIMELSGKDVLIVGPTVDDVELVASGIVFGAFSNCGQWCSSVERVFIHSDLFSQVMDRVLTLTKALRVGSGLTSEVDVGPLANKAQYDNVKSILDDAVQSGAEIVAEAEVGQDLIEGGYFIPPTVLTNVPKTSRLRNENFFGPLVEIEPYTEVADALEEANKSIYGLGASVWTNDPEFANNVTSLIQAGMVWINEPMQSLAPCPWSVCKKSGYGAELGSAGIKEFVYPKIINAQYENNIGPRPWYFPYK